MTVAAILSSKGGEVASVPTGALLREAVALLAERRIGALPVMADDGSIAGIFSERDLVGCVRAHGGTCLDWPVDRLMSSPAVTVAPDATVDSALALMTERRIRHLPVVEGGVIRGIVSIGDLVKHRLDRVESEAAFMRDYITQG